MKNLRYHKGSETGFETVSFSLTRDGSEKYYLLRASTILAGCDVFRTDHGESLELTPECKLDILELIENERKKITSGTTAKTLDGWRASGLGSFDEYFFPGDEVDKGVVEHMVDVLPPISMQTSCTQIGGAHSFEQDESGKYRNTYITFSCVDEGKWVFLGYCFAGDTVNRVQELPAQKLKELIEKAKNDIANK